MAPSTRSSAPSTPASPRPTTGTPTRRTPHCTKCHRPRAGHPRSGCPYLDASDASPIPPSRKALLLDDGLSEELSSLHIVSPSEDARTRVPPTKNGSKRRLSVRFALVPEQTLASLSPTDTHLVEQLLQPGMITDTVTPEDRVAHVLRWRKTLGDANPLDGPKEEESQSLGTAKAEPLSTDAAAPLSRRMPGTLSTPSTSMTVTEPVSDQYIGGSAINMNETVYLLPDDDGKGPKPLGRSMSFEQRSSFLQQLSHSSSTAPATLLSLPLADLVSVRADAERIGFIVRVLPSRDDNTKWVVLGTEEEAIDLLAEKFLEEEKRSATAKRRGSPFSAVAGGVVFGAVATWTGLAFS